MTDSNPDPDQSRLKTKRRWNAFVCQDCRSIFRIPANYNGKGVVCPQCERMLRIPLAGEVIPALVQSSADHEEESRQVVSSMEHMDSFAESSPPSETLSTRASNISNPPHTVPFTQPLVSQESHKGRRRKKHRSRDAENDWQSHPSKRLRFSQKKNLLHWWIASAALVILLFIIMAVLLMDQQRHSEVAEKAYSSSIPESLAFVQEQKERLAQEQQKKVAILQQGYSCAESFLRAKNVDEILPWIRKSDHSEEVLTAGLSRIIDDKWRDGELDRQTMVAIEQDRIIQFTIKKAGLGSKAIILVKEQDRYLVDWESWMGWSEMNYDQIQQNKPIKPVVVRVFVELESYYNFDFPPSEESEWQSFRLNFPNEDRFVYGYLRRDDPLMDRMRVASPDYNGAMTLTIRYKESGSHASQMMIDGIISNSWVKGFSRP